MHLTQSNARKGGALAALFAAFALCSILTITGLSDFFETVQTATHVQQDKPYAGLGPARLLTSGCYLTLWAVYGVWLLQKPPLPNRFNRLVRRSLPFLLLAFLAYPLSDDIYLYLQYGTMSLQGVNPYLTPAGNQPTEFLPFLYWKQTSTYGPISLLSFIVCAAFAPLSPLLSIYLFKGICLLAHVLSSYLIWRWVPGVYQRSRLAIAYLLNPFLLITMVSDAHVDVFLCLELILFIGCLYQRRYTAALLAVIAGVFTKTIPIVWIPFVVAFLVRRGRWRALVIAAGSTLLIGVLLSHTLLPTIAAWKSLLNPGVGMMTARSLHHLVSMVMVSVTRLNYFAQMQVLSWLSTGLMAGFAVFYFMRLFRRFRSRADSETDLVADLGWVTLALLLFASPWVMPWYPAILLPIGVFGVNLPIFSLASLMFGFSTGVLFGAASGYGLMGILSVLVSLGPTLAIVLLRHRLLRAVAPIVTRLPGMRQPSPVEPVPQPTAPLS